MNLLPFKSPDRYIILTHAPPVSAATATKGTHGGSRSQKTSKFLAAIITPWINIINGRLKQEDCALLMTNSTTAKGWMKKSNFDE